MHVQTHPFQPRQCLSRVAALVAPEQADRNGEGHGWGVRLQKMTTCALRCQHGIQTSLHNAVVTVILTSRYPVNIDSTLSLASRQPWRPFMHVQNPSSPASVCRVWQHWLRCCRPTGMVRVAAGGCGCRRRLRVHYAVNTASRQHITMQSSLSTQRACWVFLCHSDAALFTCCTSAC
jgi:hypothetical protein